MIGCRQSLAEKKVALHARRDADFNRLMSAEYCPGALRAKMLPNQNYFKIDTYICTLTTSQ